MYKKHFIFCEITICLNELLSAKKIHLEHVDE